MKTDQVKLNSAQFDTEPVLAEVEKCAAYLLLNKRQSMQLRLLGEELLGMMKCILGEYTASFWIETNEGKNVEMHLVAKSSMGDKKIEKLLGVSTSGENAAHRGFMGKVRQVLEECLYGDPDDPHVYYSHREIDAFNPMIWSLRDYQSYVKADESTEEWDELEKSIVAKLADDVTVGARRREAEVVIKKSF